MLNVGKAIIYLGLPAWLGLLALITGDAGNVLRNAVLGGLGGLTCLSVVFLLGYLLRLCRARTQGHTL